MNSSTSPQWTGPFLYKECLFSFHYYHLLSKVNVNSVDPDQTPRSAASDRGLHCSFYKALGLNGLKSTEFIRVPLIDVIMIQTKVR